MSDEWLDMKSELSRKALDTLVGAMTKYNDGKLPGAALILVVNTIYDVVSGLVDKETLDQIYQVRIETLKDMKR